MTSNILYICLVSVGEHLPPQILKHNVFLYLMRNPSAVSAKALPARRQKEKIYLARFIKPNSCMQVSDMNIMATFQ